ncbi:Na-translocating system protein MpsC family protein [Alkaliphilus crotonatoxidans]
MDINNSLLKNLKVLYVEDEPEVIQQMGFFLKKRVGQLLIAENGQRGLELFKENLPDLIISDLKMPVMDGLTMAREIRSISDVPVIITTAFADLDVILKAVDIGIDNYLIKPINVREMVAVMEKAAKKILRNRGALAMIKSKALSSEEKVHLEERIKNAVAKFVKDRTGKGPKTVKAFIRADIIEIEIIEAFTKLEKALLEYSKNTSIVKYNREIFYQDHEAEMVKLLLEILQWNVKLISVDVNVENDLNRLKFTIS